MVLIHKRLYRSDDLVRIDFGTYLRELAESRVKTYRRQAQSVSLKVAVGNIHLDIDTAIPCGLLVSALVSNALKPAFVHRRGGAIGVEMSCGDEGKYRLMVRDDKVGMPAGMDWGNTTSLGLQLVNSLSQQLGG
jgi:two-component system, sensor histidine kinase PdtaS